MAAAVIARVAMDTTVNANVASAKIAAKDHPGSKVRGAHHAVNVLSVIARTKHASSVPKRRLTGHCRHSAALSKRLSRQNRVSNSNRKLRSRPSDWSQVKKAKAVAAAAVAAVAVVVVKAANRASSRTALRC